ncbi:hypothetical protein ACE38W_05735 [Chitinophaga sp. Hz27]|uniref:hypothetical protein n=1 Tax=Chitinophaga sp. Hz27 TaxID=3347169 RepID=UPI0035E34E8A
MMTILAGAMLVAFITGGILMFIDPKSIAATVFLEIVFVSMSGVMIFALNDLFSTISIDQYGIKYRSRFYSRELLNNEIRTVLPIKNGMKLKGLAGKRSVTISSYLKDYQEIIAWVEQVTKVRNPTEDHTTEEEYNDAISAIDPSVVDTKTKLAKYFNISITCVSLLIAGLLFFTEYNYAWLLYLLFSLNGVMIIAIWYFQGILMLDAPKDSAGSSAMIPLMIINFVLFFYTRHLRVLDYVSLWKIIGFVLFLLLILFMNAVKEFTIKKQRKLIFIIAFMVMTMAGTFGVVMYTNNFLDISNPVAYKTKVLSKHVSTGKTDTYYLKVDGWKPGQESEEISVSSAYYNSVEIDEEISVLERAGFLQIPWMQFEGE